MQPLQQCRALYHYIQGMKSEYTIIDRYHDVEVVHKTPVDIIALKPKMKRRTNLICAQVRAEAGRDQRALQVNQELEAFECS